MLAAAEKDVATGETLDKVSKQFSECAVPAAEIQSSPEAAIGMSQRKHDCRRSGHFRLCAALSLPCLPQASADDPALLFDIRLHISSTLGSGRSLGAFSLNKRL